MNTQTKRIMKILAIICVFLLIPIVSAVKHISNVEMLLNQILFVLIYQEFLK